MQIPKLTEPYVHNQATIIGDVSLGDSVSIWPGAVIRADMNRINIGSYVNIQDNSTLHTDSRSGIDIGEWTLVGHNAMIHGCKIGKGVLIGIGCVILDSAEIGDGAQITAGCIIRGGKKIPPRSLVVSNGGELKIYPNKAKPQMTIAGSIEYIFLADRMKRGEFGPFSEEEEKQFIEKANQIIAELKI
ncbi:gamma carbonic anhydrase family protein [Leptospira sp. GIMC2001]|uniref:gamma carbonic anhydrase family protein n=1 Tax=Leptospira sp. GIMC2001 TaxID=1513297 RepID=UPI002349CA83|nr:gamma carbonic anhydrase family protein [Leptospira sp. GIMC2001]WCL48813.1 gamma carbonic anhydrase family protein [Leptospira sp. GIMC2001]